MVWSPFLPAAAAVAAWLLRPQRPLWRRVLLPDPTTAEGAAVLAAYGVAAGAMTYLRLRKKAAQ